MWDYLSIIDSANEVLLLCTAHESAEIIDVDLGENMITVDMDLTDELKSGSDITIRDGWPNDGGYTVYSVRSGLEGNTTNIYLDTSNSLESDEVIGYCIYGAIAVQENDGLMSKEVDISAS